MIEYYDRAVLLFINRFVDTYWSFDLVVMLLERNRLFKGGLIVAIYWALWFSKSKELHIIDRRKTIIASMIGAHIACIITIILAITLPFRLRPMDNPDLHLLIPVNIRHVLMDYNSFPSDTATLTSALATGIFIISWRIGIIVILYVLTIVVLPRIYLGFHYPTDIIAGALIGTLSVLLVNVRSVKNILSGKLLEWSEKYSQIFYGLIFILTFQVGSLFSDFRDIANVVWPIMKKIANRLT